MGMHVGLMAVRADVAALRDAFGVAWPRQEVVASAQVDDLAAWQQAHARFVSAHRRTPDNRSVDVLSFWQDGPWAVLGDPSYSFAVDGAALVALSERFGRALAFVVETTGGFASFECFEQGQRRRRVHYANGDLETAGEPLAEEAGLSTELFYIEEVETLLRRFGITPIERIAGFRCEAVAVSDRADRRPPAAQP